VATNRAPEWRKSSSCTAGNCVEVAQVDNEILIRDSKSPAQDPLRFTADEWAAFKRGMAAGDFAF